MKAALIDIATLEIPADQAMQTQKHLRKAGARGLEGMALWAGTIAGTSAVIREVIIPKQKGLRTEHGLAVTVSGEELHRINVHLYRSELRLIAQIHSHPTHAFHSDMDDRYAIATALGSFSLVVPDFAEGPFLIDSFATYRLLPGRWFWDKSPRWRKVPVKTAARTILIIEGKSDLGAR